jgi:hypothetical protein
MAQLLCWERATPVALMGASNGEEAPLEWRARSDEVFA